MPGEWKQSGGMEVRKTYVDDQGKTHYEFRVRSDPSSKTYKTHTGIKKRQRELRGKPSTKTEYYYEHKGEKKPLPPPVPNVPPHIQQGIWQSVIHTETGIKPGTAPTYHAPGSRRWIGKDKPVDLGFGTVVHKTTPTTIEQQAGVQAGITPWKTVGAKQKAIIEERKYQERLIEEEEKGIRRRMSGREGLPGTFKEFGRFWYTGFTPENVLWHRQIGEAFFGQEREKGKRLLRGYAESIVKTEKARKQYGWGGVFARPYEPGGFGFMATTAVAASGAMGAGIHALKATAWGSKALLVSKGVTKVGKPLWTLTRAGAIEKGIFSYGVYETGKAAVKDPFYTFMQMATTLPFAIPAYRAGAKWGMGKVQRWHDMTKLTSPLDKIRQKGVYDAIDRAMKLPEPKPGTSIYDLTGIERIDTARAIKFTSYLKGEAWKLSRPRIGGSAAMEIKGLYRTGKQPWSLKQWAMARQATSPTQPHRPLMGKEGAKDIDLWLREMFGAVKRADYLREPHVIDIPKGGYKPGRYYWGGWGEMPSTKGYIYGGKLFKVKAIPKEAYGEIWGRTWVHPSLSKTFTSRIELDPRLLPRAAKVMPKWKQRVLPFAKIVLKHELTHQKYPHLPERLVLLGERKPFFKNIYEAATRYYETGKAQLSMKVRTLSFKEQFMRKGVSILPSAKETIYRSYKDIPDWWDVGQLFRDPKLSVAMHKVAYPWKHLGKPPKISWGERFVKRMGGAIEPDIVDRGAYVDYIYPKSMYPSYGAGVGIAGLYLGRPTQKYKLPTAGRYKVTPYQNIVNFVFGVYPRKKEITKIPTYPPSKPSSYLPYKPPPKIPPYKPPTKQTKTLTSIPLYPSGYKLGKPRPGSPSILPQSLRKFANINRSKKRKQIWDFEDWSKRYKFRKWDVPTLGKLLKGM